MMRAKLMRRRYLLLWQLLFILLGTSWLLAPHLNPSLSARTSLISQYETTFQPYSWLFRIADLLSSALLILMAAVFIRQPRKRTAAYLLLIIGICMFSDPLLTTSCYVKGASCKEYVSVSFVLHAVETVMTSVAFFVIGIYDAWLRKKLVSIIFVLFQLAYILLFISQLASQQHFNTFSQYLYQTVLVIWAAWFCRDFLIDEAFKIRKTEIKIVKTLAASWGLLNGILAITLSFSHVLSVSRIKGLYFGTNSAWLSHHELVFGVIMLYLSRHLFRGELRARQIFLTIVGIETLRYAVVTPEPMLMLLYLLTFCALFIFIDDFDRGIIPMTWRIRLRDMYFMAAALAIALTIALYNIDRNSRVSSVASSPVRHVISSTRNSDIIKDVDLDSGLLNRTTSIFLIAGAGSLLWILFRPYKYPTQANYASIDYPKVEAFLKLYSHSSEDFFKLWPRDKEYFWHDSARGFIAYKIAGPVVYALADPISKDHAKSVNAFMTWAKNRRLKVCFLPVYKDSLKLYEKAGLESLQIGSSAVINIKEFLDNTSNDKWWRWKKNRATKAEYSYGFSSPPHSEAFLKQLNLVSDAWLNIGGHQERGFALGYFDRSYMQKCTIHYLKDSGGNILAFANELPQFNPSSIVTIDLLRYLPQANDTMPFLLYKTIETGSANPNNQYFDLGFVPFAKAKGPLLAIARTVSTGSFSSAGLERFKNKFNPDWQPNYLVYDGDIADLALIALNIENVMEAS
jgi:lysylphosphatidylglycerol synthetase-like protein (DUF2156 family)